MSIRIIIGIVISLAVLIILYRQLLQQSKMPTGFLGKIMMKLWNRVYLPMVYWSTNEIKDKKVTAILDVGIGNGASTEYLNRLFTPTKTIGIDISDTAIALAQEKYTHPTLSFSVDDVLATDFVAESFDLICAFQNHFHWNDLFAGLSELKRVLKKDGLILIACEQTKIKYYLPELTDDKFQAELNQIGLVLKSSQYKNGWTAYHICNKT
ncbi:class I SAM-dependent methyltransferase [Enterococcus alishanensis]|uniref:class I SAM-dependent methyltransferase n=1 Tax=Enterococcus alishanensis TaxID=1303817 RepID=UPI001FE2AD4A|nr:class I SAM-dependent methyltransferase [Enterococcus alishanensis]